jgi:hypothetical protein
VWNADPDFERDDLASLPRLGVVHVVGKLETFTLPEVAFGGIVFCVFGGEFGEALEVLSRRMSCSTLGPQFAIMAGPTGREGGEVMSPWPRTAGTMVRRAAMVNCIVMVTMFELIRVDRLFVKYQICSYSCSHFARFPIQPREYLETNLDIHRVVNLFGGTIFPMMCDVHCDVTGP